ncbi:glycoside hydrolase family 2 protein [Aquimarina sediminis]|uniref:glycoside hydrolase family 2 protein n=1 Tax=Aquimarina sediminis TaxID=2070536 RepID=UPI000CA010C0|nr:glycoside hydrolase family 2 TIM barrel-domain containing protein [Aquimarina sediminis]
MEKHIKTLLLIIIALFNLVVTFGQDQGRIVEPINNGWKFAKISNGEMDASVTSWDDVSLPHTWNDKDMQLSKDFYEGYALYKNTFNVPQEWENKRIFIRFEGVGQVAELYINDRFLGKHEGSFAAFVFDLSYDLKFGTENKIVVRVNNIASKKIIPTDHFLFGIYGGIYRPASLIVTNKTNITASDYASSGIYITQRNVSKERADIKITTKIESIGGKFSNIILESAIYNIEGKKVAQDHLKIKMTPQGRRTFSQQLELSNPHLWHGKKDPYLYKVVVSLKDKNSDIIDQVIQPLGVRKFEIKPGGFYLNDEKYNMYGVCRHQDWLGYGNALNNWQHDKDLEIMGEMGVTTIRLAHYQQSEYFYSKCDSLGFVISVEIPFINKTTGEEGDNSKLQMEELIKQNFNHPSIYAWGLHNEIYSNSRKLFTRGADYGTVLTRDLNEIAKQLNPDRPTIAVDNGGMERPINKTADIQGFNRYLGWYGGHMGDMKNWITDYKKKYPEYAVILSEYGAGANMDHQVETIPEYVDPAGQFFPESYATRFHETQWGDISSQDYLVASYVWNMFDFGLPLWVRGNVPARNHKGLVSFDRKDKKDSFYWYKANWNPKPMVYISDRRVTERTKNLTDIHVYCNTSVPILTVNGVKHKDFIQGKTDVHYIFKNVKLSQGINKIIAAADGEVKDEVLWSLK